MTNIEPSTDPEEGTDEVADVEGDDAAPAELEETEAERRRRELILHGPQHKGEGVSQDDIDALFD